MAACKALEFGREIGVAKVIVEGDSATVVKALSSNDKRLASYKMLVKDTTLFSNFFSELSYSLTRREGNIVAYSLAKQAMFFQDSIVWIEDIPLITSFV